MRRLLAPLVLLIIGVAILGYYRDWFTFKTGSDDKKIDINVTVDKDKVKEDEVRAKEKLKELGGQIKEETEKLSDKVKKGAGGKKTDDPPP
jgi:hypothetical protein